MYHSPKIAAFFLFSMVLVAGCAGSKEAAKAPHPLSGSWAYSLDTPQGVYTGVMNFAEVEGMLSGTIISDDAPDQAAALEDLAFDQEMSKVSFHFDGGEFGTLTVSSVLEGEKMNGTMTVGAYGVDVTLTASKKMP